jgi:hypothetical protein
MQQKRDRDPIRHTYEDFHVGVAETLDQPLTSNRVLRF